jgi:hypothetical protein
MPSETIDGFCHHCNSVVSSEVRATAFGEPTTDLFKHLDRDEEGFHGVRYMLAFCPKCESVFLYRSCTTEPSGFPFEEILYPRPAEPLATDVPPLVRRPHESAASCFATANYEPCVIMCGKTLEAVCEVLGERKGNLQERLRRLRESGKIEAKLHDWADELRLVRNDAAHELSGAFSKDDARDCLEFVEAILLYVFTLDRKFQEFRKRRRPAQAGT